MMSETLDRADVLAGAHPLFPAVFRWLRENGATAADGRHPIADGAYASVESYETHPFEKFETHRRYLDVQVIVSGEETIYLAPPSTLAVRTPYNPDRDIEFLSGSSTAQCVIPVPMAPGRLLIIWPHEAHAPGCHPAGNGGAVAGTVRKIVVKVPVEAPGTAD